MNERLLDLTALAGLIALAWLIANRIAFVIGPDACWATC